MTSTIRNHTTPHREMTQQRTVPGSSEELLFWCCPVSRRALILERNSDIQRTFPLPFISPYTSSLAQTKHTRSSDHKNQYRSPTNTPHNVATTSLQRTQNCHRSSSTSRLRHHPHAIPRGPPPTPTNQGIAREQQRAICRNTIPAAGSYLKQSIPIHRPPHVHPEPAVSRQ